MSCNTYEEFMALRGGMFQDEDIARRAWRDCEKTAPLDRLPENDLRKLAIDIIDGLVWTDRNDVISFRAIMRLAFDGSPETGGKLLRSGMVYEYMSEAGPMAINGCPMFMSFRLLAEEDLGMLLDLIAKQVELRKNFREGLSSAS